MRAAVAGSRKPAAGSRQPTAGWMGGAAFALLLLLIAAAGAAAQQQKKPDPEIRQSQQRLEQIRRERAKLRGEMTQIRTQVKDLSAELSNLERQVSTSSTLLRELETQIGGAEGQVRSTTQELLTTQDLLAERTAVLQRRLREIYKRGPLHTPQVLLAAESFADLINRYKYLYLLARRDRALVGDVRALRNQLAQRERELRHGLTELRSLKDERASEHHQLQDLQQRRAQALSSTRARERRTQQRMAQLERDERRIASLIATLERRRREAERREAERLAAARRAAARAGRPAPAAPASTATITAASRGSLAWPVQGRLVYRFGRVVQPNGTAIRWNGIGIAASPGTPVRAVEAGSVVLASPFEGYGPSVIVNHGGGFYSLYLFLDQLSVREGERVTRGQVVGTVGGQDTPQGPHLEFQLRTPGGQAVDPLPWLRAQAR